MATEKYQVYKEIAPRLFGLRESLGLTHEELAAKVDAPLDLIVGYESGDREIPVSYLMDVAHACGVNLTELLSGDEAHLYRYTVVKGGEGLSVTRRKDYDYKNLAFHFTGRMMEPFLIRVPPQEREDVRLTAHQGQEFSYVLEGKLELYLGRTIKILEPGDSVYCPTLGGLKPPPFRRQLQHFFFFTFGSYDAYGNTLSALPSSEIF